MSHQTLLRGTEFENSCEIYTIKNRCHRQDVKKKIRNDMWMIPRLKQMLSLREFFLWNHSGHKSHFLGGNSRAQRVSWEAKNEAAEVLSDKFGCLLLIAAANGDRWWPLSGRHRELQVGCCWVPPEAKRYDRPYWLTLNNSANPVWTCWWLETFCSRGSCLEALPHYGIAQALRIWTLWAWMVALVRRSHLSTYCRWCTVAATCLVATFSTVEILLDQKFGERSQGGFLQWLYMGNKHKLDDLPEIFNVGRERSTKHSFHMIFGVLASNRYYERTILTQNGCFIIEFIGRFFPYFFGSVVNPIFLP